MKNHYFLGSLLLAGGLAFSASAQDMVNLNVADYYGDNHCGIEATGETDKNGNLNPLESLTYEDVDFTFDKGEGSSAPAFYIKADGGSDLRIYAGNTMTIKAPEGRKLYSITFEMTKGWYKYGEVQASTGTMLCNGGETDVKVDDKYDALPYVWTADDILGVEEVTISVTNNTVNEKDQPNRTFDGTNAVQFRFTEADVMLAPMYLSLECLFIEDAFDPMPDFMGVSIDLEETPGGVASLQMASYVKLEKNLECEEPIVVYHDSEPMSYIYVKNDPMADETQIPGCSIMNLSFGMDENTGLLDTTMIYIILGEDPITGPGYYTVVIPDGFFTCGGLPVEASMINYEIAGVPGDLIDAGDLSGFLAESMPPVNSLLALDDEDNPYGIAAITLAVDTYGMPMVINTDCEQEITLTDADGNVLSSVNAAFDPAEAEEFQPYCMMNPFGMDAEGNLNTVWLGLFENPEDAPGVGTYFLTIPAGFFIITDEEGVQYTFSTTTYAYRIADGDVAGAFSDFVYDASPLPGEKVDLADSMWSEGLDSFQYYINAFEGFDFNMECTEPVVITRDGEVIYEILPGSDTYPGAASVTPGWAWGDEIENVITGKTEKVMKPLMAAFWIYDPAKDYMGETTVGHYTLTIPDNYYKIGNFIVKGATYECDVVDTESIVESFKAESTVTVYNMNGLRLLDNAPVSALRGLGKGLYIINGKKVIMK